VAKDLLDTLKNEKLILDWRKKQQSRASVRLAIETVLDGLPRTYTKELYNRSAISFTSMSMIPILDRIRAFLLMLEPRKPKDLRSRRL